MTDICVDAFALEVLLLQQ